jgi:hypothetical protein
VDVRDNSEESLVRGMTDAPTVPEDRLDTDGWRLTADTTETLFRLPTAQVRGRTVLYEDARLGRAVARSIGSPRTGGGEEKTDPWRFFFATRLEFSPPPAPGFGIASVLPSVIREAGDSFADDLRDRGFEQVERGRRERTRTAAGDRLTLRQYEAVLPLAGRVSGSGLPDRLGVEGWVGAWASGTSFRVAGGAYPVEGTAELLAGLETSDRPDISPRRFRDELLELVRAVN